MIYRPGGVRLSAEEALRYTDDERSNLRSWGIIVPEPEPFSPDEETPIQISTPIVKIVSGTPTICKFSNAPSV